LLAFDLKIRLMRFAMLMRSPYAARARVH